MLVSAKVSPVIKKGTISFRRENNKKQRTRQKQKKSKIYKSISVTRDGR